MKIKKSRKIMCKQKKRKTTKRKTTKRKQSKKKMYKPKKYYGGMFNPYDEKVLKQSLEKFHFSEKEFEEVIKILGSGAHYYSGVYLNKLISMIEDMSNKEEFMKWLNERYKLLAQDDETDYESD